MSLNRWVGVGRLTKDVDLRYTQSGKAVGNFTLAVNRPFTNQQGNRDADFINCVTWGKQAENIAQYMKKGSQVGVEGRVQTRTYENKSGQTVFVTEIVADQVQFLEPKKGHKQSETVEKSKVANDFEAIDIDDNDLPF